MQPKQFDIWNIKESHQNKTIKILPTFKNAWLNFYENYLSLLSQKDINNKLPGTIASVSENKIIQKIENNFFIYHQFEPIFQHYIKMCFLILQEKKDQFTLENLESFFNERPNVQHIILMHNNHLYKTIREATDFLNLSQKDLFISIDRLPNKEILQLRFQEDDILLLQKTAQEQTQLFYKMITEIPSLIKNGQETFIINTKPLTNVNIINSLISTTSEETGQSLYEHLIDFNIITPSMPLEPLYEEEPPKTIFDYFIKTVTKKYISIAKKLVVKNPSYFNYSNTIKKIDYLIDIEMKYVLNNNKAELENIIEIKEIIKKMLLQKTLEETLKEKDGKTGRGKL